MTNQDIIKSDEFQYLKSIKRHGTSNTYDHSIRVARTIRILSRWFNCDEETAVKVALLHDLCYVKPEERKDHDGNYCFYHPLEAAENADSFFGLTPLERNAIESHMFPLTTTLPRSKVAWLLTVADKVAAVEDVFMGLVRHEGNYSYNPM